MSDFQYLEDDFDNLLKFHEELLFGKMSCNDMLSDLLWYDMISNELDDVEKIIHNEQRI
jgi:hypothetical protein